MTNLLRPTLIAILFLTTACDQTPTGRNQLALIPDAILNDMSIQAFAMPGGKIGVHTGLIALADNDAQIASVMGHEVGHLIGLELMANAGFEPAQSVRLWENMPRARELYAGVAPAICEIIL